MAGVEVIGRILGCSVLHQSVGRLSGTEELTRAELPALLSGLTDHETNYALAKYGYDEASRIKFIVYLMAWLETKVLDEKWKCPDRLFLSRIAAVAIVESIHPNICKPCKGRGFLGSRSCPKCFGCGRTRLSNRELAAQLKINESAVRRTWIQRYESVFQHLQSIDDRANRVIKTNSKTFYHN